MKKTLIIFLLFFISTSLSAFWSSGINTILKTSKALPNSEIIKLSKMSDEVRGTKKIGKYLGAQNLPKEVLEDTYVRIAISQKKISRVEAEEFYKHLHGTEGFRGTMSKVIGNSPQKTAGHLNELRIANSAVKYGYKPMGIGVKYKDGLKQVPTDIDIIFKKEKKIFIIEAKDYSNATKLPMDKYRADLDTLKAYRKEHSDKKIIAIFSMTNKPKDKKYLKVLKREAKRRDIELIFGAPAQQMAQINQLDRIMQ